jgi:hypothetical protein
MAEKQVHAMATAEKVAPGSDWHIPLWTSDGEVYGQSTIGHIQSAGCLGQKEVVTAAHKACIRELLQEIDVHGKADRHMKLLTVETESRLGTLWDQEQCTQLCSKDELWEAAKEEEMKSRGRKRMRSHQYQRSSIKKDSGGEDLTELDWTR